MLDVPENASNIIQHEKKLLDVRKKLLEMLDECLNWFKLPSNIFYEKNVGSII